MPFFYAETRQTVLNRQGVERGDPTLPDWLSDHGAHPHGMDGDGTAKNSTRRLWKSNTELADLPDGITSISETDFNDLITTRENTQPVHVSADSPEPQLTSDEIIAVRAMIPGR